MLNRDIEKMPILIVDWDSSDDEIDKAIQEFEDTDKTVLVVSVYKSPASIDSDTVSRLVRLLNSDLSLDVDYSLLGLMPDESLALVRPDRLRELVPQMLYDIPEEETYKRLALVVDILGNELGVTDARVTHVPILDNKPCLSLERDGARGLYVAGYCDTSSDEAIKLSPTQRFGLIRVEQQIPPTLRLDGYTLKLLETENAGTELGYTLSRSVLSIPRQDLSNPQGLIDVRANVEIASRLLESNLEEITSRVRCLLPLGISLPLSTDTQLTQAILDCTDAESIIAVDSMGNSLCSVGSDSSETVELCPVIKVDARDLASLQTLETELGE